MILMATGIHEIIKLLKPFFRMFASDIRRNNINKNSFKFFFVHPSYNMLIWIILKGTIHFQILLFYIPFVSCSLNSPKNHHKDDKLPKFCSRRPP